MLINKTILNGEFTFRNAEIQDVAQMEYVQSQCYPTLSEREIFKKHHFENHITAAIISAKNADYQQKSIDISP